MIVLAQNQTNEGLLKIYIQINYDYANLNWLLLSQNLQIEGEKLIKQKLEI